MNETELFIWITHKKTLYQFKIYMSLAACMHALGQCISTSKYIKGNDIIGTVGAVISQPLYT